LKGMFNTRKEGGCSSENCSLRDRHQRLKDMNYEDKILKMNIAEMCLEDQAQYGPMQEAIRGQYCQTSSSSDFDLSLD